VVPTLTDLQVPSNFRRRASLNTVPRVPAKLRKVSYFNDPDIVLLQEVPDLGRSNKPRSPMTNNFTELAPNASLRSASLDNAVNWWRRPLRTSPRSHRRNETADSSQTAGKPFVRPIWHKEGRIPLEGRLGMCTHGEMSERRNGCSVTGGWLA
jgi:hypothetical protein